jgi:hypothetical protein
MQNKVHSGLNHVNAANDEASSCSNPWGSTGVEATEAVGGNLVEKEGVSRS